MKTLALLAFTLASSSAWAVIPPPILSGTTPPSPANNNNPHVIGTNGSGVAVHLYRDSSCTQWVASGVAAANGTFDIAVTVPNDSTRTFRARREVLDSDGLPMLSPCSTSSVTYTEDSTPPATPILTFTTPASPSSSTSLTVSGVTSAGATVYLHSGAGCGAPAVATGTATGAGQFTLPATAMPNATMAFFARARDAAGNFSTCSAGLSYRHDDVAPASPALLGTDPPSPSADDTPAVQGNAEAGATVRVHLGAGCPGTQAAAGPAGANTFFSVITPVDSNTWNTLSARAVDAAGNVSPCSNTIEYLHATEQRQLTCGDNEEQKGASRCFTVPPVAGARTFVVDGTRSPREYFGAVGFPYVNVARKFSGGTVYVNVTDDPRRMHVFLDDLLGTPAGEIRVYLDYDRFRLFSAFEPAFVRVSAEDRAFAVNLQTGAIRRLQAVSSGGPVAWQDHICNPACPDEDFEAALGAVTGIGRQTRFDVELSLPLRPLTNDGFGRPGLGLAVAQVTEDRASELGAFPEDLVQDGCTPGSDPCDPIPIAPPKDTDRTLFQTVRLARPGGFPLTVATWNVKRFTDFMHWVEDRGSGNPLDDTLVPSETIGEALAGFDVVGLQEVWSGSELTKIVDAANAVRMASNPPRPPFRAIGPIDHPITAGVNFDSTHGGVYLLSPFPAVRLDPEIFDDCRGEDCMKSKGVLHARLNFSVTTIGGDPDMGPTRGDDFIDVYVTHLQADQQICGMLDTLREVGEKVNADLICQTPLLTPLACLLEEIVADNFRCDAYADDAEVRRRQLQQMGRFVAATADPRRPAIILGDFNFDGRHLNHATASGDAGYGEALALLGLTEPGDLREEPDDRVTPFPEAWDWDIDHADVVRQQFPDEDWRTDGHGTFIGADGVDDPGDATHDPPKRYDYIFVRSPVRPEDPEYDTLAWVAAAGDGDVWASPFLSSPDLPTEGGRLSDHKPVVSSLRLVQLQPPSSYHPTWPHLLGFSVTSAVAAGISDCMFDACGPLDLFTKRKMLEEPLAGGPFVTEDRRPTCSGSMLTRGEDDDCLDTWGVGFVHDPVLGRVQGGGSDLYDDDDGPNDDDHFNTVWTERADVFSVNWPAARVQLRKWDDLGQVPAQMPCVHGEGQWVVQPPNQIVWEETCRERWRDTSFTDNGPQGVCTRQSMKPPVVCYELHWEEVLPPP